MGRGGKLKLELVENEKTRTATFNKRLAGLKKKAKELTILCNVRLCMVILGPKLKNKPFKVDIWPDDPAGVRSMILDCKNSTSSLRRIFTMSDYLNLRQRKVENEIANVRRANFKARFRTWDDCIDKLSPEQIISFRSKLDSKLEAAKTFPPKNLTDNYLQSLFPFDHHIQTIPQNYLDYGLFMGQHSGNHFQSHHLPMKNLDYGLIMGQHSGNHIQSHDHLPLKTRNQFDHIQAFPHKNYGIFMEQPPIVSKLSQGDDNLLNLSLNLNANKNRLNPIDHHKQLPMSMMNNIPDFTFQPGASSSINQKPMTMLSMMNDHLDFNIQQLGLASSSRNIPNTLSFSPLRSSFSSQAAHHDSMPTMQDNVMFKQPKPYDAWFTPPSMQPDHQASNFDQQQFLTFHSESDPRFFYRNMNHEDD
ncbi:Transcription factor, MADS-box [Corchorus olitorius]|uniref:Transcription factor, MADS-box n=1 Tax=Corchorus olitorius TaxID=93759 RepID=A0A1R3H3R6_9ROSI|nr:Transcription factor, MADS-box [Corchorus olitorius]